MKNMSSADRETMIVQMKVTHALDGTQNQECEQTNRTILQKQQINAIDRTNGSRSQGGCNCGSEAIEAYLTFTPTAVLCLSIVLLNIF